MMADMGGAPPEKAASSMSDENDKTEQIEQLLQTPDLAGALESEQFKRFLDQVPITISVSDLVGEERIVYANPFFEKLSEVSAEALEHQDWAALRGESLDERENSGLSESIVAGTDCVGTFRMLRPGADPVVVDAYSNVIEDDSGKQCFRLVALVDVSAHSTADRAEIENRIREKDTLLRELQHRVKNNLQM